jgi:transcriptional regulator with XRE-family HTH domain
MAKKRTALELGEAVRQARQGAGLILAELANKIDTGISVISQYELGQSNTPAWRLHDIAKATGYTFSVDKDGWHIQKSKKRRPSS